MSHCILQWMVYFIANRNSPKHHGQYLYTKWLKLRDRNICLFSLYILLLCQALVQVGKREGIIKYTKEANVAVSNLGLCLFYNTTDEVTLRMKHLRYFFHLRMDHADSCMQQPIC